MTHPREDTTRSDDVQRVSAEVSNRLEELGIWLSGAETPEELVRVQDAVEKFELAVVSRGGDLMVDEAPRGRAAQPDHPHFALPTRHADESVQQYLERLLSATDEVKHHSA